MGSNSAASTKTSVVAADHAAQPLGGAPLVRDDGLAARQRVGLAVQRRDRLARPREAHHDATLDLGGVEDMERPADVEGHIVGDVDQRRYRTQADRDQTVLQPARTGAVPDATQHPADEIGTGFRSVGRKVESHRKRALEPARDRLDPARLQPADTLGRKVAGNAADAEAVLAVGGDRDIDHGIVETERPCEGLADRRVRRQVDDAVVLVGQTHLARRTEHAIGGLAADRAGLEQ
jgi:hypothetical protein